MQSPPLTLTGAPPVPACLPAGCPPPMPMPALPAPVPVPACCLAPTWLACWRTALRWQKLGRHSSPGSWTCCRECSSVRCSSVGIGMHAFTHAFTLACMHTRMHAHIPVGTLRRRPRPGKGAAMLHAGRLGAAPQHMELAPHLSTWPSASSAGLAGWLQGTGDAPPSGLCPLGRRAAIPVQARAPAALLHRQGATCCCFLVWLLAE